MSCYLQDKKLYFTVEEDGVFYHYLLDIDSAKLAILTPDGAIKSYPETNPHYRLLQEEMRKCFSDKYFNLCSIVCNMFSDYYYTKDYNRKIASLQCALILGAAEKRCYFYDKDARYMIRNKDWLIKYIAACKKEIVGCDYFHDWCEWQKTILEVKSVETITLYQHWRIANAVRKRKVKMSAQDWDTCVHYLTNTNFWDYEDTKVGKLIDYIKYCHEIDKAPKKEPDFIKEFTMTAEAWEQKRKAEENR